MASSIASPVSFHHTSILRNPGSQEYFYPSLHSLEMDINLEVEEFLLLLSNLLTWLDIFVISLGIRFFKKKICYVLGP